MSNYCGNVDEMFSNIQIECPEEGFESEAIFLRRADIDFSNVTYDDTATGYGYSVVTEIALNTGANGAYVYQLKNSFSGTSTEFAEGDFRNGVNNNVVFNVWSSDAEASKNLTKMLNGEYVCITRQKYKDTDGIHSPMSGGAEYRVYGLQNGLKMSALSNDPYADSLGNGWNVTMTESSASIVAQFLCAKDDAGFSATATKTMYESLATK